MYVDTKNTPETDKLTIILGGILLILSIAGICAGIGYLSGQWLPSYNARITTLSICSSNTIFQSGHSLSSNSPQLYACGKVEGTTFLRTVLYLFYEGEVIYQETIRIEPGTFYIALPPTGQLPNHYKVGNYQIQLIRSKLINAETEFQIIN